MSKILSWIIILTVFVSVKTCLFPNCHDDITLCKDNADVIKNFKNVSYAINMCKKAAAEKAKWGTPQWSDHAGSGILIYVNIFHAIFRPHKPATILNSNI